MTNTQTEAINSTNKQYLVKANKWRDSNGNTYHAVELLAFTPEGNRDSMNDHYSDITYGYDEQYIVTAYELAKEHGWKGSERDFVSPQANNEFSSQWVKRKKDL